MKHHTKLTSQEQEQLGEVKTHQTSAREFSSVEELLRHDAGQTTVPSRVAERLGHSIKNEPAPSRSWWKRLFGQ